MTLISVSHPTRKIKGIIHLPASKSISNRLLIMQAVAKHTQQIPNLSDADDTIIMKQALDKVSGTIDVKNAGTCLRFLTAYFASTPSEVMLVGTERLYRRPMGELIDALRKLGADITCLQQEGFAPLKIRGRKLKGGFVNMQVQQSSQHVSALMLIAPAMEDGLQLSLEGNPVSSSYIDMTEKLMRRYGFKISRAGNSLSIAPVMPFPYQIAVEPDWSSASYWYTLAALSKESEIRLPSLSVNSLQGDAAIADLMQQAGCLSSEDRNGIIIRKNNQMNWHSLIPMRSFPDLVPAMTVAAVAQGAITRFDDIAHLSIKESNRLRALAQELSKCGFAVVDDPSGLTIGSSAPDLSVIPRFSTYNDHRLAMSFAALALVWDEVKIENPEVVEKSYPQFWNDLKLTGFQIRAE